MLGGLALLRVLPVLVAALHRQQSCSLRKRCVCCVGKSWGGQPTALYVVYGFAAMQYDQRAVCGIEQ